jgi:hypothetical protein
MDAAEVPLADAVARFGVDLGRVDTPAASRGPIRQVDGPEGRRQWILPRTSVMSSLRMVSPK